MQTGKLQQTSKMSVDYQFKSMSRSISCFFYGNNNYQRKENIGAGAYGMVGLFTNEANPNDMMAVKKPVSQSERNRCEDIAALNREVEFWNKVYPDNPAIIVNENNDCRLIMPFIRVSC